MEPQILKFVALILLFGSFASAQKLSRNEIEQVIERDGCLVTEEGKVKICKSDYRFKIKRLRV